MALAGWDRRFFATTRGQIVSLLRRASHTVDELAASLGLTDNAVRAHLATLERDGLVQQRGVRRGAGKPAHAYALSPGAEALFPKAYEPVLRGLLDQLGDHLPSEALESLLRAVGQRLAADQPSPRGDLRARLEAAATVMNELGGLVEVEEREGVFVLRGYSCPLAAVVPDHPQVCTLAEALIGALVGVPVRECCDQGDPPRCCFEVAPGQPATAPADDPARSTTAIQGEPEAEPEAEPLGGEPACWAHLLDDDGKLT